MQRTKNIPDNFKKENKIGDFVFVEVTESNYAELM